MTLGSLFDGSGGFPLAGMLCGITPVLASEVEPFPIRVTTKRIPQMKHLGDVSKIDGGKIEPVDIITFGSPCQDLSIAGKRAGLEDGERSNLFFQAIRIIKEMREATNGRCPTFIVWENVPGAFSTNGGQDFRSVLTSVCGIAESGVSIPMPEEGRWRNAGEIVGDGYSVAWRVLDAQYFGVAQRRRRIFLVADFGGERAKKVLFEPGGMPGDTEPGKKPWDGCVGAAENRAGGAGGEAVSFFDCHGMDGSVRPLGERCATMTEKYGTGGNNVPLVCYRVSSWGNEKTQLKGRVSETETARTLDWHGGGPTCNQGGTAICVDTWDGQQKVQTLTVKNADGSQRMPDKGNCNLIVEGTSGHPRVRRLTPTECARLQGFPDRWAKDLETEEPTAEEIAFWRRVFDTDSELKDKQKKTDAQIVKWLKNPHTDSAEYRMWGNGVALPCVKFVLNGIKEAER